MKIKLINKEAKTIKDAYGLSKKDLVKLDEILHDVYLEDITNIREHIIPLMNRIDFVTKNYIAEIIGDLEDIEIRRPVDLIETICNMDKDLSEKYISIIFRIKEFKNEILEDISDEVTFYTVIRRKGGRK